MKQFILKKVTNKTPYELLDEAGYRLFECKNEQEINSFRKYYEKREELCTFYGGRLNRCIVFFAVRKDVDKIKRKDFKNPKREDEDGTYKVSLRSNDNVNVSDVAEIFGGGGHERAAGCTFSCSLEDAIKKLIKEVNKVL